MDRDHFTETLRQRDPLVHDALFDERARQQNRIELIASENSVSLATLTALGSVVANKTLEGYPGKRFHGGGEFVDVLENAARDRARELFGAKYANVQPHSGTQANQAVLFALLKPGDRIVSMKLADGGHLSHGASPNLSGRWFDVAHYGVDPETGLIDYDAAARIALEHKPKLLIAGGSAYPREIDFARMRAIADQAGCDFLVDMAHFAGLVAGGVHPSPVPHADIVTLTTTKTLRGPRGGVILSNREDLFAKLDAAVFPGVQGSLHSQVIAAKAVALGEALRPEFRDYAKRVRDNARTLAKTLAERQIRIVSGGTDTHLVLVDVSSCAITGEQAEQALADAGITSNKNPVPGDASDPARWNGLRLGTSAATTRGFAGTEFQKLGNVIADLLETAGGAAHEEARAKAEVARLCAAHPVYPGVD